MDDGYLSECQPRDAPFNSVRVRRSVVKSVSAARLAVPDWLTEVVPDWLAETVRPKKVPRAVAGHDPRRVRDLGTAHGRVRLRPREAVHSSRYGRAAQRHDRHRRPVPGAGAQDRDRGRVRRRSGAGRRRADSRPRLDRRHRPGRGRRGVRADHQAWRHRLGRRPAAARVHRARAWSHRGAAAVVARGAGVRRRRGLGDHLDHAGLSARPASRRTAGRRRRVSRLRQLPALDRHAGGHGGPRRGHDGTQRGVRHAADPPVRRRRAQPRRHPPGGHPQRQPSDGRGRHCPARRWPAAAALGHRHDRPARRRDRARIGGPGQARAHLGTQRGRAAPWLRR